jgi:DNA helicase-2/ATP-dependent DNA helicase PcrA
MTAPVRIEELFAILDFHPNDQQRQAIMHVHGPLYLPAGPGAGKTSVLLWRTINLIVCHNIKPEHIFLSTFTEKAARRLRDGIESLLAKAQEHTGKSYDIGRMYIGTIHSLSQKLIRDRRLYASQSVANLPALVDQLNQYFVVVNLWKELLIASGFTDEPQILYPTINALIGPVRTKSSSTRFITITNVIAFFNRCSEEYLRTDGQHLHGDPTLQGLLRMYARYLALMDERHQVDLSALQGKAYELVRSSEKAQQLFSHIIIDEYQDTNPVQEKLFFALAAQHKNFCVVGDDDQAMYRFRGATVENFVTFPANVRKFLHTEPTTIPLTLNYRSHPTIVNVYNDYMQRGTWTVDDVSYRADKVITPASANTAAYTSVCVTAGNRDTTADELAALINNLLSSGKVQDPNEIAVLFPSIKGNDGPSDKVIALKNALAPYKLDIYAPRAGRFVEVDEARDVLGVLMHIIGKPTFASDMIRGDYGRFSQWCTDVYKRGTEIITHDPQLVQFVTTRRDAINERVEDRRLMFATLERHNLSPDSPFDPDDYSPNNIKSILQASGASDTAVRGLGGTRFDRIARDRLAQGTPFLAKNLISRATTFDYSILDIFYQLLGFAHFTAMLDLAEYGDPTNDFKRDEGPICNLALISRYLSGFLQHQYSALLSARDFTDDAIIRRFWISYIYVLFRNGEGEYEDEEMLFPKGRIPVLTIHQAKGLEFPVVILGNPNRHNTIQPIETLMRRLVDRDREPETLSPKYDNMRLFYVALSRAQNLCVIAHYTGHIHDSLKPFVRDPHPEISRMPAVDLTHMPSHLSSTETLPKRYSYTADYTRYLNCPRQYMFFRTYDFAPSQTRAQMFGSLVHRTIDEIHQRMLLTQPRTDA